MKWLGYTWAVATALVTVAIALGLMILFDDRFQKVVVDLLILIYVATRSGSQMHGFIAVEQARLARDRFLKLLKGVGDPEFDNENHREALREEDESLAYKMNIGYIHATANFIIFLAAVGHLVVSGML